MAGPQTTPAAMSLDELVQTLPQELQDEILEHTLTVAPEVVDITRKYRPPLRLAISRATRKKFAKSYYEQTSFQLRPADPRWGPAGRKIIQDFILWIRSLSVEHAALIKRARLFPELASRHLAYIFVRSTALQYCFQHSPADSNAREYKLELRASAYTPSRRHLDPEFREAQATLTLLKARVESM